MIDSPTPPPAPVPIQTLAPIAGNVFTNPATVINVHSGQSFVIALPSNRTTGYSWTLITDGGVTVQPFGSTYFAPVSKAMGAGGTELWIFRALAAGNATLKLRYARPFDRGDAKTESFRVLITQ